MADEEVEQAEGTGSRSAHRWWKVLLIGAGIYVALLVALLLTSNPNIFPTLVLVGSEDGLTPPADARAMAGAIPGARVVEAPGSGHLSPLENPRAVNAALRRFLLEVSAG